MCFISSRLIPQKTVDVTVCVQCLKMAALFVLQQTTILNYLWIECSSCGVKITMGVKGCISRTSIWHLVRIVTGWTNFSSRDEDDFHKHEFGKWTVTNSWTIYTILFWRVTMNSAAVSFRSHTMIFKCMRWPAWTLPILFTMLFCS